MATLGANEIIYSDATSVVVHNGQNIMSLTQDMTVDIGNVGVTLEYTNATIGWRTI